MNLFCVATVNGKALMGRDQEGKVMGAVAARRQRDAYGKESTPNHVLLASISAKVGLSLNVRPCTDRMRNNTGGPGTPGTPLVTAADVHFSMRSAWPEFP